MYKFGAFNELIYLFILVNSFWQINLFLIFLLLNEFITFIVVQWSSQSSFIGFPSHNPSASPHSLNCLLRRPEVFQSLWVSICSAKKFTVSFFQTPHVSEIIWCWCLIVWLTSLSMIISRSIHVAKNASILFLVMAE